MLVDFELTAAVDSYDSATNSAINQVETQDGVVVGINYRNNKVIPLVPNQTQHDAQA